MFPRTFREVGLRGKLITAMVIVGGIPLIIGMAMALLQGTQELHDMAGGNFASLAAESARTIDLVLSDELTRTARIARAPIIVARLEASEARTRRQGARANQEEAAATRWAAGDPDFLAAITEGPVAEFLMQQVSSPEGEASRIVPSAARAATRALFITDSGGAVVASTTTKIEYSHRHEPWWRASYDNGVGQPVIGTVARDRVFGTQTFHISLPVMDRTGSRAIGVLHRIFDARDYLAQPLFPIRFGKTGHVMVLDSRGTVVACPILPSGTRLADQALISAVTRPEGGWVRASTDGHGGTGTSIIGMSMLPGTSRLMRGAGGVSWHTFVWQASDELSAPTHHFVAWLTGFGVFALSLLAVLGFVASGRIVTPIRTLQDAASRIARGALSTPIVVNTGDELEQLADEMNRMNEQLALAFRGLTDTVEQKDEQVRSLLLLNQEILDAMPNPIVLIDQSDRVTYWNEAARTAFSLDGPMLPPDLEPVLARRPTTTCDMPPSEVRPAREPRDPLIPPSEAPHGRQEISVRDRLYRYEWFHMQPTTGPAWRGLSFVEVTEERRLEEQVVQAERLIGLSRLTSGLGHELNNPLYSIMGLAEAIVEGSDPVLVRHHAHAMMAEAKRMAQVIKELTADNLAHEPASKPVDLNSLVEEAIRAVQSSLSGIEVRCDLHPLPRIEAPPGHLRTAIVAILTNAAHAVKGGGTIDILTESAHGEITVRIQDSGCGIPAAHLSKVFDPFFTTKRQGEGRGLGLTLARQTVERLGGQIRVDSQEGEGATMTISLPVPVPSHL